MVGSVLMNRMVEEKDFNNISDPVFFSTSQVGEAGLPDGVFNVINGDKDLVFYKDAVQ